MAEVCIWGFVDVLKWGLWTFLGLVEIRMLTQIYTDINISNVFYTK